MTRASTGYSILFALVALGVNAGLAAADENAHGPVDGDHGGGGPQCGDFTRADIDDFEDGDTTTLDGFGGWYTFNDGTKGAVQLPEDIADLVEPGGPADSDFAARTSGSGFTAWGAGLGVSLGCPRSVAPFAGVQFSVREEGPRPFSVELVTLDTLAKEFGGMCTGKGCNAHFAFPLAVAEERWYECSVRFEDLAQPCWGEQVDLDLEEVLGLQFHYAGPEAFDMTVDDVRFASELAGSSCVPLEAAAECR
ncbi:MAG TPA: hypothetical protein VNN80_04845 [Polyangiaceae bacterium]|nr:hypothetical protein [Polyangiaceae bacterium]